MLSVIITAKDEAKTVGLAVNSFLNEKYKYEFEIIVAAPDRQTLKAAKRAWPGVKMVQDGNRGKAAAMNLAINEAKGDVLIFSDGDVFVQSGAVANLLNVNNAELVSARPIAAGHKKINKYIFWQQSLFDMAHKLRSQRAEKGKFLAISGYLFLIKKSILADFKLPENLLAEDEYLSYWAWHKGYRIKYAANALVNVKYPDNYQDWVKQKTRTLAGSYQIPKAWKKVAMRSFARESFKAWQMWISYVTSPVQAYWMILLFMARLDVWLRAFWKVKILKHSRQQIWQRVESSK